MRPSNRYPNSVRRIPIAYETGYRKLKLHQLLGRPCIFLEKETVSIVSLSVIYFLRVSSESHETSRFPNLCSPLFIAVYIVSIFDGIFPIDPNPKRVTFVDGTRISKSGSLKLQVDSWMSMFSTHRASLWIRTVVVFSTLDTLSTPSLQSFVSFGGVKQSSSVSFTQGSFQLLFPRP